MAFNIHLDLDTGNPELNAKISEWLDYDKNSTTRTEVETLVIKKDHAKLEKKLMHRMEFGTAGLRAALGAGYSCMNDVTIIQTTQGLCKYAESCFPDIKDLGIVIGHDARHGSHRFARLAAAVFLHSNIKVYLYSDIVCTPFVPYAVVKYKCAFGIMVTASHNPKEDNGYKVYYKNGAQIIPPHDSGIASEILLNLKPLSTSWDEDIHKTSELCIDPLDEVLSCYMSCIQQHCNFRDNNEKNGRPITYTAMHGVGMRYEKEAFKAFSLQPFFDTKEQSDPDPEFPTVVLPNPEEGKNALNLAMRTAESNNSQFIIANDPDADRLAIAEKHEGGAWKVFTGNETGLLLGWWAMFNHKRVHPEHFQDGSVYMLYSTVSSHILRAMGKLEGFNVEETLTGFKWLANGAIDLMAKEKHVLFAFEEAIGFMYGSQVLDKDGISAGAVVSEMANYLYSEGKTVNTHMLELYKKYGVHISNNSYFICHSQPTILKIFQRIRTLNDGSYPKRLGSFDVLSVRDLTGDGFDSSQPNNKPVLPTSSSQMLTFQFSDGCVATIRTSGTEPKIKYYSEIAAPPGMSSEKAQHTIDCLIAALIGEWMQPEENGLQVKLAS